MTKAYIYKWTHLVTSKWYIGSRTKKGSHPDDGYICSSKIVKPLIESSINDWVREILYVGNPDEILKLESQILAELDAKNDLNSFNLHNGDGKFTTAGITLSDDWKMKIRNSNSGKKRSQEAIENYKKANREKAKDPNYLEKLRKPKPQEHGRKISEALTGKPKTEEHRRNLSRSQKQVADKLRTGKSYEEIYGAERAKKIRDASSKSQKGRPCNNPFVTCPNCDKTGPSGAMNRWHFDNCKKKKL